MHAIACYPFSQALDLEAKLEPGEEDESKLKAFSTQISPSFGTIPSSTREESPMLTNAVDVPVIPWIPALYYFWRTSCSKYTSISAARAPSNSRSKSAVSVSSTA